MKLLSRIVHSKTYKVLWFTGLLLLLLPLLYGITGIIQIIVLMIIAVLAEIRYHFFERLIKKDSAVSLIVSVLFSMLILPVKHLYPHYAVSENLSESWIRGGYLIIETAALILVIHPVFNYLFDLIFEKKEFTMKKSVISFIVSGTFFFTIFVYLPCDSFLNNLTDFNFPLQSFIWYELLYLLAFSAGATVILSFLKDKIFWRVITIGVGIDICVYIQYMFLNKNLILIDGEAMRWENYRVFSVFTLVLWGTIITGTIFTELKFHMIFDKVILKVPFFISGIQILTVIILTVFSGSQAFEYKTDYLSAEEQYTVSARENVIMFILDATDNSYFEEILKNNPDAFDGFEDFTLYTNTCSVLDFTTTSITQMFTGMAYDCDISMEKWIEDSWNSPQAQEFYDKFHEAGYVANGYNANFRDERKRKNKLDNCVVTGESEGKPDIDIYTKGILTDFRNLSLYRILPFAVKKCIDYENIDFNSHISAKDKINTDNYDFERDLNLKLSETEKNYFIVQHLLGTHSPCEDFIGETEHLLKIIRNYIEQLKELGVYDSASIIITADHGKHNEGNYEQASTPILMIKRKNVTQPEMSFSGAPVYHEDIQATLLDCAGLYDKENDEQLWGRSMFDIEENEQRTRTWIDRVRENYHVYTYTGDTDTLRKIVAEGNTVKKVKITN